jgi:hypothetical protein
MTSANDLNDLMQKLFSISIDEVQGELERASLRAAVFALQQIEQRAKSNEPTDRG